MTVEPLQVVEIARLPDGEQGTDAAYTPNALLVASRQGRVFRFPLNSLGYPSREPDIPTSLDLRASTSTDGDQGLLALEVCRDTRVVLLYRTVRDGSVELQRVSIGESGLVAESSLDTLMTLDPRGNLHHGGGLVLSDDGSLHLGVGDGETAEDNPPGPQDLESPFGAVVRIPPEVVEGSVAEPFEPGPDDLVAIGLRNPWRMSKDELTGDIWIGDVGDGRREEVSVLRANEIGRVVPNFGWPVLEGDVLSEHRRQEGVDALFDRGEPERPHNYREPLLVREHSEDVCAVIGGHVYRGSGVPSLVGAYVFGDLCSTELRAAFVSGDQVIHEGVITELPARPWALARSPAGEVIVLDENGGVSELRARAA